MQSRVEGSPLVGAGSPQVRAITASILMVDDRPANLALLADMLAPLGESIVQASSGLDALRHMLQREFAIVLIDIRMPDVDGYELATLIRKRTRTRHTPIIFISAYDPVDHDVSRGYALGAVDYVFTPIDPVILRAKVSVFVELYKKTEAVRAQAEAERRLQQENLRVRSEKQETEQALRRVEERQSLIIRSLPIALYTAGLDGRFCGPRFLSDSIAEAVGFEAAQFVEDGDLWVSRIHPADLPRVLAQVGSVAASGTLSVEYRWRCADGSERVFLDQGVLTEDESGEGQQIFGTCLDVTYRRRLESQLAQAQKMEAIGQLTGGIAHDFNNMISVILWNLESITRLMREGKVHDRAQNALFAALNCAELIRQLLTFARSQPRQAKPLDVGELISRVARLLTPVIGERIRLEVRLAADIWPVIADPAQLESALLNLAINARDAMPRGGALAIAVRNLRQPARSFDPPPGDYVEIAVCDTGSGMAQEVIDRAFEPFFTTKEPGRGSGLGLSMVYGFVRQAGGQVRIDSEPGSGTTIRLWLPRGEGAPPPAAVPAPGRRARGAARRILVVEDDPSVRGVTMARLDELGHEAVEADGAQAALELLRQDAAVEVLFTDVVMPGGMSGLDLARRALELRPGLRVIFASGYAASFHTTGGISGELLQKPYSDEDLLDALHRAFASSGAPPRSR